MDALNSLAKKQELPRTATAAPPPYAPGIQQPTMAAPVVQAAPVMQAPMMQAPMVQAAPMMQVAPQPVVMQQPTVMMAAAPTLVTVKTGPTPFTQGLCNCFINPGLCLLACFMPCIPIGQAAEASGAGNCVICGILSCIPPLQLLVPCCIRGQVRTKKQLVGDCCGDLCVFMCCYPCAVVQMAREIGAYQQGEEIEAVETAEEAKENSIYTIQAEMSRI